MIRLKAAGTLVGLLVAALLLASCGQDMLATTKEAQESAPSPAAAISGDASASGASSASASQEAPAASGAAAGSEADGAIEIAVEVDASNAHAYNAKFPESLGTFAVTVQPGATVLDALAATGLDYSLRGKSYVASIGGIEDKVCGRDSGWLYLVDGVEPQVSASDYELNGGEAIRWAYTVTEGDV